VTAEPGGRLMLSLICTLAWYSLVFDALLQFLHWLKGRVQRIFFFASFKLPLFNEYEMVFIMA